MVWACNEICWCCWSKLCEHVHCCWVICSCIHNMLVANNMYSIIRVDYSGWNMMCLLHLGVTTSELTWYHMHLEESRTLHAFIIWRVVSWMNMWLDVLCLVMLGECCDYMSFVECCDYVTWDDCYKCGFVYLANYMLVIYILLKLWIMWSYDENQLLFMLIMIDVKLTPSGRSVDRQPICMNG